VKNAESPLRITKDYLPSSIDAGLAWLTILETQPHRFPGVYARYEYRYPFLDRQLVDFLLRVPPAQIRRPGNRRSLLRRALRTIVVPEVLERKRKAFPARGPRRFVEENREEISALIDNSHLSAMGYIDKKCLREILAQMDSGTLSQWRRPLMRTIELELWLRGGSASLSP
jgi:asparagine synthase (glutamine-hydrolysing)